MFCLPGSLGYHAAFLHDDYFCLPHLDLFFITGMDLPRGALLGGNGYGMRGRGAGGFVPSLGLLVMRGLQKKGGVRINPLFSALTGRTPGRVGLAALGLGRHKKGGDDDLKKLRSNFYCFLLYQGNAPGRNKFYPTLSRGNATKTI